MKKLQMHVSHTGAINYLNSKFGDGSLPMLAQSFSCSGTENNLTSCGGTTGYSTCYYGKTAGVRCFSEYITKDSAVAINISDVIQAAQVV